MNVKGIVHPKLKIISSFANLHAIPNLYEFLSSEQKVVAGSTDYHSTEKNTMEANREQQLFGYTQSSKYLLLCSTEEENKFESQ